MARKIKMAIGATVFALCFSNLVLGQLIWPANNLATPAFSRFGEIAVSGFAANQTRSIGIGNFTANAALTHAFLDINSNYLLLPTNVSIASFGEVFRTTSNAPAGTFNAWRMYTGAGIGTEIFNISNSGATNIVSLGTTQNGNLNFFTNNMQRITIVGLAGPTQGFVSIGNTFTTPLFRLDVQDNINVNPNFLNDGYRISGITVLQIPGFRNTFVGRGTGINYTGSGGENTFVGFNAGNAYVNGGINDGRNTFVGSNAGVALLTGGSNTFVGTDAGLSITTGSSNTFIGEHSGWKQVSGNDNTYLGSHSGQGTPGSAGHRTWMNVGTFCWQTTDNMYVGLKDETALFGTDICILKRNSSGIYSQTLTCI